VTDSDKHSSSLQHRITALTIFEVQALNHCLFKTL
jgi:hypothetical protein